MHIRCFLFISSNLLLLFYEVSHACDSINSSNYIRDDGRTLVSSDGTFEFGFFSPGSSKNRYVGIWYKNIPVRTVVWVANRINPINDSSGMLMINSTGYLALMSQNKRVVWSANSTRNEAKGSILLQLLNSGNLVLRAEQLGSYLWQSFDHPSDTLLPEMKLGWDLKTGLERRLTAWKSWDDPSLGDFTWGLPQQDFPEAYTWKGSNKFYRSGPWNVVRFSSPEIRSNPVFEFNFASNEDELYYTFNLKDKSVISRVVMNQSRYVLERLTWSEATQSWTLFSYVPRDYCDSYGLCGAYGNCITTQSPICQCLEGFKPESTGYKDWSQGCVRKKPLNYSKLDGFIKFDGLKWPDTTHSLVNTSMNLRQCREKCLENSSCMAYTNSNERGGSGCAMWFSDLTDIRQHSEGGKELFIRMSASELGTEDGPKMEIVVIVVTTTIAAAGFLIIGYYIYKRRANLGKTLQKIEDLELPLFEFVTIARATNNFSFDNKLGEGGYGPVYKGTLEDGQEIAIKRLSKISKQGLNEFKNEVILIIKLQHRNLVKLLGCCTQGEEKILIYEFMLNKSLNHFIFDQTRSKLLDWSKRFQIICGIARGLLYLHQDSRLRIIHRDLKTSNVLLDDEFNPKISDFGLAKILNGDQAVENMNKIVGTYGYMAPEYAINGIFSTKSDVFSFGILLLELVSGKKRKGFCHPDHNLSLIGHAWKLWKEGKPLELIDPTVGESCNASEAIRSLHVSLLCMEHQPDDRPTMSSVILMLGCETALPEPKQPGFLMDSRMREPDSSNKPEVFSSNEITMSLLEVR